jgi:CRISPR-associated protein Csx10
MVPEPGLVFVATGRLTSDEESLLSDFKAAVRATTHIGSGRSGGLARVEMELQPDTPAVAIDPLPPGPSLEIAVELTTPASLGVPIALGNFRDSNFRDSNFRDTRRWVPGSALRGAVGFALAEILDNPDDPDFQALVHEDKGAIFDFLYPVDDLKASPLAAPWPITAQSCKAHREHGVFDTLLSRIAVRTASGLSDIGSLGSAYDCPICKGPPGGLKGNRRAKDEPGIQIVTRVAMDRKRASARDGMLFSCAQVERGTRFVGQIRGIPERGRARLAQALRVPLSVGRGRSMGWGSLKILGVSVPPAIASIQERGRDFDAALPALCAGRRSRLVVLTLLSPLVIDREQDDGRATLSKAMGVPISSWPVVARKFDLERGWDQRRGLRDAVRVARAGSVFVGELPEGTRWQEILPALQRIEAEGAGQRTRMGFGRVICFDPLIYQGAKKP